MRLTCPNCGAQYEVPDDVIPEEGRDVQCSNCGDTWFQQSAGSAPPMERGNDDGSADPSNSERSAAAAIGQSDDFDESLRDDKGAEIEFASRSDPEIAEAAGEWAEEEPRPPEADDPHIDEPPAETVPKRAESEPPAPQSPRGLDPALSDILREEAERESSLRAADQMQSQTLETQPNLGLDDLPENEEARRARQAQDRMARIQGQDPRRLAAEASGLKRGVLPDIEEINSTLRAADSPAQPPIAEPVPPKPRKSGFTRGFALALLIVLAMVMVYANAPQIAEILPQADPYLSSYVTWVDKMRLWLDMQVSALQSPQI
jgi:predicted Zn finger-like uncharacterized protein